MFNEDCEQPQTKRLRTDGNDNCIWDWNRTGAVASSLEHTLKGSRDYEHPVEALVTVTQAVAYGETVRNGPSNTVNLHRHEKSNACTRTRSLLPTTQASEIGLNPLWLADQVDLSSPTVLPETFDQVCLGISQTVPVSLSLSLTGNSSLVCFGMVSLI